MKGGLPLPFGRFDLRRRPSAPRDRRRGTRLDARKLSPFSCQPSAVTQAGGGHCLLVVTGEVFILFMKAAKLLDHVKALPPRERQRFLAAVRALEEKTPARPAKKGKRVEWPDVQTRAKRIFGDRVLPNLVLLEREEEPA